jgi:hypothetical protein
LNHETCSRAIFAQKRCGSRSPCARSAFASLGVQLARFRKLRGSLEDALLAQQGLEVGHALA